MPDSAAEAAGLFSGGTMEWPLLAAADLIIGLGVDEAEMIPAAWDYRGAYDAGHAGIRPSAPEQPGPTLRAPPR